MGWHRQNARAALWSGSTELLSSTSINQQWPHWIVHGWLTSIETCEWRPAVGAVGMQGLRHGVTGGVRFMWVGVSLINLGCDDPARNSSEPGEAKWVGNGTVELSAVKSAAGHTWSRYTYQQLVWCLKKSGRMSAVCKWWEWWTAPCAPPTWHWLFTTGFWPGWFCDCAGDWNKDGRMKDGVSRLGWWK